MQNIFRCCSCEFEVNCWLFNVLDPGDIGCGEIGFKPLSEPVLFAFSHKLKKMTSKIRKKFTLIVC